MIKSCINKFWILVDKILILSGHTHEDTLEVKVYLSKVGHNVVISTLSSWVLSFVYFMSGAFNKYVLTDRVFLEILLILFICDLFSGIIKHWKLKTLSFTEMSVKFLIKMVVSLIFMVVFNLWASIPLFAKHEDVASYFLLIGQLANGIYIGGSVFRNLHVITNGIFPPMSIMERTKDFNKTLDVTSLIKNKDENRNIPNQE